jgi:hypothetical protein
MRRLIISRQTALAVIIAMVAQSWLVPLATAAAAAGLNAVTICTASGFKVITLPEGTVPPSDDGSDHAGQDLNCTACLAHALGKAALSAEPGPIVWPGSAISLPAVVARSLKRPFEGPVRSRAPPTA